MSRLAACHGAARMRDLHLSRAERRVLSRMVDTGLARRHPDQVVGLPDADPRVVTCRRTGGVMSCAHAMRHYGLPLIEPPGTLHVAVASWRGTSRTGVGRTVVHRVREILLPEPAAPPVAEVEQALIGFMRCANELDALIALDAAVRAGRVDRGQVRAALPGPRNAPLRALLDRTCPRARSLLETIARYELEAAGYRPYPGVVIEGIGEVDIVLSRGPVRLELEPDGVVRLHTDDPDGLLIVETDGYTYHAGRQAWVADNLRKQAGDRTGLHTTHVIAEQVLAHRTVEVIAPIAARLGIHPCPGSAPG